MAAPTGRHEFELCTELCDDFIGFQEQLKKKRTVDDRVINVLNDTVPLKSFSAQNNHAKQCEELYSQLVQAYNSRDQSIRYCINTISQTVQSLREKKVATPDDFEVMKALRKEQTKLRLMQGELSVEEIIRDRTLKAFHERCREHYRPPNVPKV